MRLDGSGLVVLPLTLLATSLSRLGTGNQALQASKVEKVCKKAFYECFRQESTLSDPSDLAVTGLVIWYHPLQGAGGDSFGACGCEHKRQWCAGSGLERAREGLCSLQAGQLYWPKVAPQVGSS